jgi:pimeloyl-ACP methyl ester carboxylesterase
LKKAIKILGISILFIYLGLCTLLYIKQDDLLFHPKPNTINEVQEYLKSNTNFDTLTLKMNDQTKIYGFISKDSATTQTPLIVYFGGNAEEVSHIMSKKRFFPKHKMVFMNYRGYGLSEGEVSEKSMFSDAIEIYDKLKLFKNVDSSNIFVIGRSIGTGVATYLSLQRKTRATILITPYENMIDVASEKYPFVPISLLIKHRFESDSYAPKITSPMFSLIATNDEIIPKHHAYKLVEAWKGKTYILEVNEDHSSIMKNEMVWQKIDQFIKDNSN